jgi:predicted kinase
VPGSAEPESAESAAQRQIVLVTGAPGAGKTALAVPLAAEMGFALLAKDRIKETLAGTLGDGGGNLACSQRLGAASMELLWALAAYAPAVVLEANFWPDDERHQRQIRALGGRAVEVYCACPLSVAVERYAARQASRHPVHAESSRVATPEAWARWARPVGIGELITVDTSRPVDIAELASDVRAKLGAFGQPARDLPPAGPPQVGVPRAPPRRPGMGR